MVYGSKMMDLEELRSGQVQALRIQNGVSRPMADNDVPGALIPGAFDPVHWGHRRMTKFATKRLGKPVHFELSLANVDKSDLPPAVVPLRLRQFRAEEVVWLTCAATFEQKALIFPGTTFVIGADTALRIGDPKYYEGDEQLLQASLSRLMESNCRFLVFGRRVGDRFQTLRDLPLPALLHRMCTEISEAEFREDISSTEIRGEFLP